MNTSVAIPAPWQARLAQRRALSDLVAELGEHLGRASRDASNLAARACPVCRRDDPHPDPEVRGPVYDFHRCRGCSLLYAPAVFRPDVLRRLYAERPIYRRYWGHQRGEAAAQRGSKVHGALIDRLLLHVPGRAAAIDVGCGFGKLVEELAPHFGEVFGLELNRRTAQEGAALFGVSVRCERLERLERASATVDLIVMNQVLEHLQDVRTVIDAAFRLLRPGGVLYVGIPHGRSVGMRVRGGAHPFVATHVHVNLFTRQALTHLARTAGFAIAELSTSNQIDLSAVDWLGGRLEGAAGPFLLPVVGLDKALRAALGHLALPSLFGLGSHLDAVLVKPE